MTPNKNILIGSSAIVLGIASQLIGAVQIRNNLANPGELALQPQLGMNPMTLVFTLGYFLIAVGLVFIFISIYRELKAVGKIE